MSGPINNTGATQGGGISPLGQEKKTGSVDAQDADSFANQVEGGDAAKKKDEITKDEVLELMKKSSFNEHLERQKELEAEIKKNLES